ncbi:MAG: DUF4468 domain-containing protein [Flavobacteriales bacterium]|nr:DUF4468 domain-containing protein [Flavobacteriales bacterium]
MKSIFKILITTIALGLAIDINAQDYNYDDPYATDTTNYDDPYGDTYNTDFNNSFGDTKPVVEEKPKPEKKPYIRFEVPFDTITELVTYTAVVEEEEAGTDSLYWRAKRWINYEFSKKDMKKKITKDDKKEFKIIMVGVFPLFIEANKYSKVPNGSIQFDMELRFKEGRYRYKINNLVHLVPPPPGEKNDIVTYFEFYRKSTINPKGNDMVLISADKKIHKMIDALQKYCKEPIYVDDDDW